MVLEGERKGEEGRRRGERLEHETIRRGIRGVGHVEGEREGGGREIRTCGNT